MDAERLRLAIAESCLLLDEEDFAGYLALFAADATYRITAYSPELRREMVWLEQDRTGFENLLNGIENHVRMQGRFFRHPVLARYSISDDGATAETLSTVTVYFTDHAGTTKLYCCCRYEDSFVAIEGNVLIRQRIARLETRDLGSGSHIPI
jgi:methanesulfonate monooxygenase small subunit